MPLDQRRIAILAAAAALRLLIFIAFPGVPDFFTDQVEVSTPVTSYKRLKEGLFLYGRDVSPYDGGLFHQAPLLLPIFSLVGTRWAGVLFTVLDLMNASALGKIAESGQAVSTRLFTSSRKNDRLPTDLVSAAYLFNPFTIISCLGRSTNAFTTSAIIHAVASASVGDSFNAMLALAFASYMSMYPVLLLPSLVLMCWDRGLDLQKTSSGAFTFAAKFSAICLGSWALLLLMSASMLGWNWDFIGSTYGVQLSVPDLTPNAGLWWYFFVEIFDSFRNFFIGVFWLHLAAYVGGLTFRIRRQPLFVMTSLMGLFAIFKPYPSISDVSLYFGFLPLYKHVLPLMRYTFIAQSVLLYATLLGPAFHYIWIYAGSGNANFFYAITLVWSLGMTIIVGDSIYAVLRDEWEVERPEMKGKEVRQL